MRSKHHVCNSPRIHLYPDDPLKKCSVCDSDLIECYRSKPRRIRCLEGEYEVIEHVMACNEDSCCQFQQKVYPRRITPPNSSYHFDVIIQVGISRKKENRTYKQILRELQKSNLRIGKSRSCVKHLMNYYEIYELLWEEEKLNGFCQGQDIVLSIDGAKPSKGSEVLYTVNEAWTKKPIVNKWTLYSDTVTMEEIFNSVKAKNLNVVGIVSDKQKTFLLGVQEVFGELPHQLCQYHWLKQAGKPLFEKNSQINTQLKKYASKIRYLTTKTKNEVLEQKIPPENFLILKELELFLTVILTAKSKPPFRLISLQTWKNLSAILCQLLQLLESYGSGLFTSSVRKLPRPVKRVIQAIRILAEGLEENIWNVFDIKMGLDWLIEINLLIDPKNIPIEWFKLRGKQEKAKNRLQSYLQNLSVSPNTFLEQLQKHISESLEKWQKHLFTCFDFPHIPRTSSLHEESIKSIKHPFRKLLGHSRIHRVLRGQQSFPPVNNFPNFDQMLVFCTLVFKNQYKIVFHKYWSRREVLKKEYRIKRGFRCSLNVAFQNLKEEIKIS